MSEKFREPDKAASYVSGGLADRFPSGMVEVIHINRNRPQHLSCAVKDLGPVLQRMCRGFGPTSVDYHPDNAYGFVAEMRSHAGREGTSGFRKRREDRERVVVLLTQVNGKRVTVGSKVETANH